MKGYKSIIVGVATAVLGILESTQVTTIIAQHPGAFATAAGIGIIVLRWMTTTPIFQGE